MINPFRPHLAEYGIVGGIRQGVAETPLHSPENYIDKIVTAYAKAAAAISALSALRFPCWLTPPDARFSIQ